MVAAVDAHDNLRIESIGAELYVCHSAHYHPGALYRRPHLQTPDIFKTSCDDIAVSGTVCSKISNLEGQHKQRPDPGYDKYSDP